MNTLISKAKQLVLEMDDFLGIADDDLSISEDSVISTREEPTQTAPSSPEPQTQILTNLIETSKFHSVHLFALNPLKYSIQVRLASTHAVSSNPIVISTSISKIPPLAIIEVYNDSGLLGICKLPVPSCSKCSIVDLLTSKTVGELIVGVSINDNDIENLKQKVTLLSGLLEAVI